MIKEPTLDKSNCTTLKVFTNVDKQNVNFEVYKTIKDVTTRVWYGTTHFYQKDFDKRKMGIHALYALSKSVDWSNPGIVINCPDKDQRIIIENVLMDNHMDNLDTLHESKYKFISTAFSEHAPIIEFTK
jgi:hypothetical protein